MQQQTGIEFTAKASRQFVTPDDNNAIALVGLKPIHKGPTRQYQEGNFSLALTIDCSGSMDDPENPQSSVTKLDRAIEGLREIAGQIRSNDRFSLIAFDDHVAPMITGASGEERHRILNAIDQLRCRFHGGTNVYGALEQAYANLQTSEMSLNPVQTVILLTDGEITVGRGEKDCCRLATKMAEQGIVIDTLGYGTNYHIDFITELVEPSGGSQTYALTMADVHNALKLIFSGMRKVGIINVKLTFDFPQKVKVGSLYHGVYKVNTDRLESIRCYSRVPISASGRQVNVTVGQLEMDKGQIFALELSPSISGSQTGETNLVEVQLSYSVLRGQPQQESRSISVKVTQDQLEAKGSHDFQILGLVDELKHSKYVFELGEAQRRKDNKRVFSVLNWLIEDSKNHGWTEKLQEYEQLLQQLKQWGEINEVIVKAARSVSRSTSSVAGIITEKPAERVEETPPVKRKTPFGKF
ncbi:MAG: hypothetical protein DDT18_00173 [Actinobacteria bacterium]|nr:hypothetical protein [Bacillota bacterium]MBT9169838.1 hypothetical protein [Actinomycetota bacterium]